MSTIIKDFTMGADPEFACVDERNRIVTARNFVHGEMDEFGADGCGVTFEVRPAPSKEPLQIVHNIHDIFTRQIIDRPEFLKFKWLSGTWQKGYPLGGHVHFGIKENDYSYCNLATFLDNYVGSISILLELRKDGLKRRQDGYGGIGDYRTQDWGFEYRPMSSWISSPYVAAAILCLSKTVAYEALNNQAFEWKTFVSEDDFYGMNQQRILSIFPEIWAGITKMYLYQVYKPYIDWLYFLVTNKLTWLSVSGLKESWGVVDMKPCISNKIDVDVIWHRYNAERTNI